MRHEGHTQLQQTVSKCQESNRPTRKRRAALSAAPTTPKPPQEATSKRALFKLRRYRFLTELWRQLDDQTVKLLGFKHKPSYKTVWHWLNKRVGPDGLEAINAALIEAINQAIDLQEVAAAYEFNKTKKDYSRL